MPHTLIVEYDIEALSEAEFQQFLEEVADLAIARKEKRFTPGRPAMRLVFNVTDRGFDDIRKFLDPMFDPDITVAKMAGLTPEHIAALGYTRTILENNGVRGGQDKVSQHHTQQCNRAIEALDLLIGKKL